MEDVPQKENWSGIVGLLLVPLFIFIAGWGIISMVGTKTNDQYQPGYGIGGGPPTILSPSPTLTITPGSMRPGY